MHKGKKITLLPLTPAQIVQAEKDRAANSNNEPPVKSKNQQAIHLKAPVMLATKSNLAEIHVDDTCCYALVCTDTLFSNDDIARTLPASVTNLLQEFSDVFSLRYLQAFLQFVGLSIKLILFLEQVCPTVLHIGQIPKRLRRFNDKSKTFWTAGIYVRTLVLVLYLSFWFQKKMAVGTCVYIVEPLTTSPLDTVILSLN
jgi:hypothetical protein